jgi:hypothetical protein
MCGYEMDEIVGRNCRFLVDPVPQEYVDEATRNRARNFTISVTSDSSVSPGEQQREAESTPEWVPLGSRSKGSGVYCAQVNMRKDGTLFNNMFYLKEATLGEKTYIIGLQTELDTLENEMAAAESAEDVVDVYRDACRQLDMNMAEVERILSKMFWFSAPMRRQDDEVDDGFLSSGAEESSGAESV